MPPALRVKPFVISTEDIKLDKGLMTSTIEIEKFKADDKRLKHKDFDDDSDGWNRDRTEMAPSESDLSQVMKKRVGPGKSINIFTGEDPMFNVHNLKLRVQGIQRKDVYMIAIVVFVLACAVSAVLVWFKIVLKGFAN